MRPALLPRAPRGGRAARRSCQGRRQMVLAQGGPAARVPGRKAFVARARARAGGLQGRPEKAAELADALRR